MTPWLEPATLPADAVEVGKVVDAWGVKGWIKVQAFSPDPQALFSAKRWYLVPPESGPKNFAGACLVRVQQAREHSGAVIACLHEMSDRNQAETMKSARIFVPRSSFPSAAADEYYWVDLLGLKAINRQGDLLGRVCDLLATGAQTVLVLKSDQGGEIVERMIPFVGIYIDKVDLDDGVIHVDWQADY
ncbi:MAG: ribosome maturation factor RimM [Betaproteobacteria bacterium]|nr:ribosome maturation factor RimM [Betaproteobacteria bacterium]NBY06203.1 ribosome maturation factor RimM [Betaproteobacteria bacterium]